jgi:hypothetical protein
VQGGDGAWCFRRLRQPQYSCPVPPSPSGYAVVLAGSIGGALDTWAAYAQQRENDQLVANSHTHKITNWSTWYQLVPNDRNFPAGGVPTATPGMAEADIEGLLTGIYASAVGCLVTYDGQVDGSAALAMAATTIDRPSYGYAGMFNFFDPDNFLTLR